MCMCMCVCDECYSKVACLFLHIFYLQRVLFTASMSAASWACEDSQFKTTAILAFLLALSQYIVDSDEL